MLHILQSAKMTLYLCKTMLEKLNVLTEET